MIKMLEGMMRKMPLDQRVYYDNLARVSFDPLRNPLLDPARYHRERAVLAVNVKETADKLLPNEHNNIPKWVNHHDIAIAVVTQYPGLRPEIESWVNDRNWKEFWVVDALICQKQDGSKNLNLDAVQKKYDSEKPGARSAQFIDIVADASNFTARDIVEIGSGVSPVLFDWARQGEDYSAIGIDYQELAVWTGNEIYRQFRNKIPGIVRFETADIFADRPVADSALNRKFDVCYNYGLIEHFTEDDQKKILKLMIRLTKPGGIVLVAVPNYWSPSIIQRRLIHLVARRHDPADNFNLWWPFGYEQPMTRLELRALFGSFMGKDPGITDIRESGITPFHDFKWDEIWKYSKLYGRTSWYMPNDCFGRRFSGMAASLFGLLPQKFSFERYLTPHCDDGPLLEGQYRWIAPTLTPFIWGIGGILKLLSAIPDVYSGGMISKYFGNQILIWAQKTPE